MKFRAWAACMAIACCISSRALAVPDPGVRSVDELCQFVADKLHEPDATAGTKYVYQSILFARAGVDAQADDAATRARKMQAWWNREQQSLYCNVLNSNVRDGHILRLAVDRSASDFLTDVVRRWKLDLNHRDRHHGGTVLDFIDEEIAKSRGTPRETVLRRYEQLIATHGGKRQRELR